jgi:predicted site-specific integrase-resolvase
MNKFIGIEKTAKILRVPTQTLRRWECTGGLIPECTGDGQRRYDLCLLRPYGVHSSKTNFATIAYMHVSSSDQKIDLECQKQILEMYYAVNGWAFEIISDISFGKLKNKKIIEDLKQVVGSR